MSRQRLCVVGLGSSLGPSAATLAVAASALAATPGVELLRASRVWQSLPMGTTARGLFHNAALLLRTSRSPRGLLARCKELEERLGRRRSSRWGDRVVDLDLLLVDGVVRRGRGLTLPHPGLALRDFALWPAQEVAPALVHPLSGTPLGRLGPPSIRTGCRPVANLLPTRPQAVATAPGLEYSRPPRPSPTRIRCTMKFFLDTANIEEIKQAHAWGVIDGVTTNPSLVAKEGGDLVERIYQICQIVEGPVSAETVATDWEGMVREGRLLAQISEHVVVKVPLTVDGIRATRILADDGIDVNVTLCFQAAQALVAAKAGAAYISPFMGRLDDISSDGTRLIEEIVQIYANYPELGTEVLAASIRHPMHVTQTALAGADVCTLPFSTLRKLVNHPLTDSGLKSFLDDWAGVPDPDVAGQVERWLAARSGD
ncbi:MAG: fructose-6-phosphate aldolase [Alphaproteobacteria bacterium]|nr:fructose-6-phosphate aldolase [Alphaproteobacteria bacterium]